MSLAGKILLHTWHSPLARLRDCLGEGGPFEQRRTRRGHAEMSRAALLLPELPDYPGPAVSVHLLTGRRFWDQTVFCLWSLSKNSNRTLAPRLSDDGSLLPENRAALLRLFPQATIAGKDATVANLDRLLPVSRFPTLRERWRNYPNIRKLIDPHLGSSGWKLVLDSDLLFFRRPDFLLNWLENPDRPLHAVDCETSYGYSRNLINTLAGLPTADLVNVGLTGLKSELIDWEKLEFWAKTLIGKERTHYYLEQALVAMLLAGQACAVAPAPDYVTKPEPPEAVRCTAVMHHYVAGSKRWYFQNNWRRSAQDRGVPSS